MRLNSWAVMGIVCTALIAGAATASAQETQPRTQINVLRPDTTLENSDKMVQIIQDAIANEVKSHGTKYDLSVKNFTYLEIQMETGCDAVGDTEEAVECYKKASKLQKIGDVDADMNNSDFVFTTYDEGGATQIIWYHAKDESFKIVEGKIWNEANAEALAHEIFVRKLVVLLPDATAMGLDKDVQLLHEALLQYARGSEYLLDEKNSELTYSEIQTMIDCMDVGRSKAANMCYILASSELKTEEFIFSTINEGGQTQVIWYGEGAKGIHVYNGVVNDMDSAQQLAKDIFVGKVGFVKVTSNVPGASIYIAGERVGMAAEFEASAQPIELVARDEPYEITVREKGYSREDAQRVYVREGETSHIHVDMAVMTDPEEIRKAVKIAGYTTLGVGALGVVAGGVLYALASNKNDELGDKIKGGANGSDFHGIKSSRDDLFTGSVIAFGVGGGLLVAGAIVTAVGFLYDFSYESMEANQNRAVPKIDFNLSPDYQGMTLGWTF